ncbi:hypothetical protein PoB_002747300 [Plakobranchus ocellatus]|uniref:Reverse transcriptase domain-containing protein n=1 Tax=Plakobranchus ocellatus TaxID=259542 RepID=A0AAV4A1F0_9GAST|nr:hypothetical protein PoB_002747300 [Plakobranchus ocellatus]
MTKAFDIICREGLWRLMSKCAHACVRKFTITSDNFSMECWPESRKTSAPFPVSNGKRRGCVLAPTLFSLMCSAIMSCSHFAQPHMLGHNELLPLNSASCARP